MKATNIGVIGCGYWGPNLLRNFAENEGAQLRWICDIDEDRLASMSRRYPMAQTTTDYRVLVSDPALDAVAVVTQSPRITRSLKNCCARASTSCWKNR